MNGKMLICAIGMLGCTTVQFFTKDSCPIAFCIAFAGWCAGLVGYIIFYGDHIASKRKANLNEAQGED